MGTIAKNRWIAWSAIACIVALLVAVALANVGDGSARAARTDSGDVAATPGPAADPEQTHGQGPLPDPESPGPAPDFHAVDPDVIAAAEAQGSASVVVLVDVADSQDTPTAVAGLTQLADGVFTGELGMDAVNSLAETAGVKVSLARPLRVPEFVPATPGSAETTLALPEAPESSRAAGESTLPRAVASLTSVDGKSAIYSPLLDTHYSVEAADPELQSAQNATGISGHGQVIAIVDSGIDTAALGLGLGKVIHRQDFSPATANCNNNHLDGDGHGTHVASIAAGSVVEGVPSVWGVATNAKLLDLRVFNCEGDASIGGVETALGWLLTERSPGVTNAQYWGVDVVNLSLGWSSGPQNGTDVASILVNRLVASGIFVSVASGNFGAPETIFSPGTAQWGTTVGSIGHYRGSDYLSFFSSQGPVAGRAGVDVLAPGSSIMAAKSTALNIAGPAVVMSGTSMSAPFVAGTAALLLQQDGSRAPSGTWCSVGPSCPEGVVAASMTNGVQSAFAVTDWFEPGLDPVSGAGPISASSSLDGSPTTPAVSVTGTLDGDGPVYIKLPSMFDARNISVSLDEELPDTSSTFDSFEYMFVDYTMNTQPMSRHCIMSGAGCVIDNGGDPDHVWTFYTRPAYNQNWLRIDSPVPTDFRVVISGTTGTAVERSGVVVENTVLDENGTGSLVIRRTAASAVSNVVSLGHTPGLSLTNTVILPAGPIGTSVSMPVAETSPGTYNSNANTARVTATIDSHLIGLSSVSMPANTKPGQVLFDGAPLQRGYPASVVAPMLATNGTLFGASQQDALVRAPSSSGFYDGLFVVDPGSNEAVPIDIHQNTVTYLHPVTLSGDGQMLVAYQPGPGSGIVPGDTDSAANLFVYNRGTDTAYKIGNSTYPARTDSSDLDPVISESGDRIAFITGGQGTNFRVIVQSGATFSSFQQVVSFSSTTFDGVSLVGVTDTHVIAEIHTAATGLWSLRAFALAGGPASVLAEHMFPGNSQLSVLGTAVGYTDPDGLAMCYRFSDGATRHFKLGGAASPSHYAIFGPVAPSDDCGSVVTTIGSRDSGELQGTYRFWYGATWHAVAAGNWFWYDKAGNFFVRYSSAALSPGDVNGHWDLYRGPSWRTSAKPSFQLLDVPTVVGPAVEGRQLTVLTGSWTPSIASKTIWWLRDGVRINGASGETYIVTSADVGHRISAMVIPYVNGNPLTTYGMSRPTDVVASLAESAPDVGSVASTGLEPGLVQCYSADDTSGVSKGGSGPTLDIRTTVSGGLGAVCGYGVGSPLGKIVMAVGRHVLPADGITLQPAQRLLDSRSGTYPETIGGSAQPSTDYTVQVSGNAGVPVGASAALVNIAVTDALAPGEIRLWEAGTPAPSSPLLELDPGISSVATHLVKLSPTGEITFVSSSTLPVHITVDVVGYVAQPSRFNPSTPTRIVDTRAATQVGPLTGRISASASPHVVLSDTSLVPADATAVVLNVTAIQPSAAGALDLFPDTSGNGSTLSPQWAAIKYVQGVNATKLVVVMLPPSRSIGIANYQTGGQSTDLVVDVVGYMAPID